MATIGGNRLALLMGGRIEEWHLWFYPGIYSLALLGNTDQVNRKQGSNLM